MPKYRAFIEMTFEPDENGFLEWESFEAEFDKPRTEEEMKRVFTQELYDFVSDYSMNILDYIQVVKE